MAEETGMGEKQAKPEKRMEGAISESAGQINEVGRAVKILEDKYTNLRRKVQISEENFLTQQKKASDDLKVMQSDLLEVKRDIADVKDKIRLIVKELKLTAKSEDIRVVQKYLDLWDPVHFVTREEAKKMIERAVEEKFR